MYPTERQLSYIDDLITTVLSLIVLIENPKIKINEVEVEVIKTPIFETICTNEEVGELIPLLKDVVTMLQLCYQSSKNKDGEAFKHLANYERFLDRLNRSNDSNSFKTLYSSLTCYFKMPTYEDVELIILNSTLQD